MSSRISWAVFVQSNVCSHSQVSPQKMLRIAFGIRALSSSYIQRVFVKTEMTLKSRSMITGSSRTLHRSKSSENLPSSQSQVNIQMMSRTLTIREVRLKCVLRRIVKVKLLYRWWMRARRCFLQVAGLHRICVYNTRIVLWINEYVASRLDVNYYVELRVNERDECSRWIENNRVLLDLV